MINYNKELLREINECDDPVRSVDLIIQLQNNIMGENTLNAIVQFATECLVYQLATPQIPVSQSQYEAITRMFRVKGTDGRGGDRRSKKYKDLNDSK